MVGVSLKQKIVQEAFGLMVDTEWLTAEIREVKRLSGAGGMSYVEYRYVAKAIVAKAPCNLLVFGTGFDSELWLRCNHGGVTVFIEDSQEWIDKLKSSVPTANVEHVEYLSISSEIGASGGRVVDIEPLVLSKLVMDRNWDVIVVDAPKGNTKNSPGRSQSIRTASSLRNSGTIIIVHDVNRPAERVYCEQWLGRLPRVTPGLAIYGHWELYVRCQYLLIRAISRARRRISRCF